MKRIITSLGLVFTLLLLSACVSTGRPNSEAGMKANAKNHNVTERWFLVELKGADYSGKRITLELSSDQRASGFSGCNRYSVSIEVIDQHRLQMGPILSTKMACKDLDANRTESEYLSLLESMTRYQKRGSRLILEGEEGTLVYLKKSAR